MVYLYWQLTLFFSRLMFDPYDRIVYDYLGGMEDIKKAKVCMYLLSAMFSYIFAYCISGTF